MDETLIITDRGLRNRLDLIMHEVPHFWDQASYPHFTNHGPAHSERIHRYKIPQLVQELPPERRLSDDEIFIISAAAWLYEIGMQSPNLHYEDVDLGVGQDQRASLSFEQLQKIRENKHLLSYHLIIDSVRSDYAGPPLRLGLTRPADDYVRAIAEVCRGCSSEPLEKIHDRIPVNGMMVRIRLLVALLRLADQLYIESLRINLDRLQAAPLDMHDKARWWMYHYAQTLPIDKGNIRFHYLLPSVHQPYLGHIRTLLEPDFTYAKSPIISALRDVWDMRLMVHPQPEVILETPPGFQRQMSPDMLQFLRREIAVDPNLIEIVPAPEKRIEEKPLLVLDYENLLLQLGREGYFLSLDDISRLIIALFKEANSQYKAVVTGLAAAHWDRPDLAPAARIVKRAYQLLTVEDDQPVAEVLRRKLADLLQSPDAPSQTLLVAPHEEMSEIVRYFSERKLTVNAWISDLRESDVYSALILQTQLLTEILKANLPPAHRLTDDEFSSIQAACILRIDDHLHTDRREGIPLAELPTLLEEVKPAKGHGEWWCLYLLDQHIVQSSEPAQHLLQLNPNHDLVIAVLAMCDAVIQTLQSLMRNGQGAPQHLVERNLLRVSHFQNDPRKIEHFLALMQEESIVENPSRSATGVLWSLNGAHWRIITAGAELYLPLLILGIDHFLVREGYQYMHETALFRRLAPYVGQSAGETLYHMASQRGWVETRTAHEKHRLNNEPLIEVRPAVYNEEVQQILLNRNILFDVLHRKAPASGMEQEMLWSALRQSRCTLSREEMNLWLTVFQREALLKISSSSDDLRNARIGLNSDSQLVQRLFGRFNIFGVVQTMRIMGATHTPERARPVAEIEERIAKYITHGQIRMASWALQYARSIGLVEYTRSTASQDEKLERAWMRKHHLVYELDTRERAISEALATLVRTLSARRFRDGRVPLPVLRQEMEKDRQFGFTHEEYNYWLNQAEHRQGLLKRETERPPGLAPQHYILLKPLEVR